VTSRSGLTCPMYRAEHIAADRARNLHFAQEGGCDKAISNKATIAVDQEH